MSKAEDQILVIFGASGDLTYRKLIPAIFDLHMQDLLPEHFAVLGVSRSEIPDEDFRTRMIAGIKEFSHFKEAGDKKINEFVKCLYYLSIDTKDAKDYGQLTKRLNELNDSYQTRGNYIFYLSTPPLLYKAIPAFLSEQGLNRSGNSFRRLIIEKPFGTDLKSARELNAFLLDHFNEEQIYRIDHYLGKETVQNVLVTRFANSIYEPLWNRNYIHHVEITAAENIGVGSRGGYYEGSGALRDMLQNHLLQLVALVSMEPPTVINSDAIRNEKLKVFQALRPLKNDDLFKNVVRGQYLEANVRGVYQKGYRDEDGVAKDSRTETFIALKLFIDNWRWGGVPFYLRTGKRLPTRVTEIVIHFKPTPHQLFIENKEFCADGNILVIRIQPDEGILIKTGMKIPGSGFNVKNINMDFHYKDLQETYVPSAYERLLLDCMIGDATLYSRGDGVEEAWEFVQPILDFWGNNPDAPLFGYPCGTWGPDVADNLIEDKDLTWRYPCKNLADDGIFCEL